MYKVMTKLTVFFENPFWVGVFEQLEGGKLSVCKVTFGSEPKDYEVYEFILNNYCKLKFSTGIDADVKVSHSNPKRLQREVRKQTKQLGSNSKSQVALKKQIEENKIERKFDLKCMREQEKQRKFEIRQEKRKQKHRGK